MSDKKKVGINISLRSRKISKIPETIDEELNSNSDSEIENNSDSETNSENNSNSESKIIENLKSESENSSVDQSRSQNSEKHIKTIPNICTMAGLSVDHAIKLIPEFKGEKQNLDKFINCVDMFSENLVKEEDTNFLVYIIKTKLTGEPYDIVKYQNANTWIEIKKVLKENFSCTKSVQQLQLELNNCRQYMNEDVRTFSQRIEQTLSFLNKVSTDGQTAEVIKALIEFNGKSALNSFQNGLIEPIKLIIKASRFVTLSEAINCAIIEENNLKQRGNYNPNSNFKKFNSDNSKNNFVPQYKNNYQKSNNFQKPSNFQKFDKYSHSLPQFNKNPQVNNIQKHCNYCKKPGHLIAECRKREFNNKKKKPENTNQTESMYDNTNSENYPKPGPSGIRGQAKDLK